MCGILWALLDENRDAVTVTNNFMRLEHRGPDATRYTVVGNEHFLGNHRLAIINTEESGNQPLEHNGSYLICNGQLYNYKQLAEKLAINPRSDVDVILHMDGSITDVAGQLDGDFAFVLVDPSGNVKIARDPVGVRPLFYGVDCDGNVICVASEVKALVDLPGVVKCHVFPPGHVYESANKKFTQYTDIYPPGSATDCSYNDAVQKVKMRVTNAVHKRITNSDRPVAFLCSGGVDSSIVTAVARDILGATHDMHMFSVEFDHKGSRSDDSFYASLLARQLNTNHTIVKFTWEDVTNNIHDIVKQIESYDPNTIRASIPMYFLAKYIREHTDYKVILSGEGADEIFMGYNIFAKTPDQVSANEESQRLVKNLHMFDVLRADRTFAAHGLELRVPFLDKDLLYDVFRINGEHKMYKGGVEKKLLRDAFGDMQALQATRILDRGKERFSDGCGCDYVPCLLNHWISDDPDAKRDLATKERREREAYHKIFATYYVDNDHLITKRINPSWCGTSSDDFVSFQD